MAVIVSPPPPFPDSYYPCGEDHGAVGPQSQPVYKPQQRPSEGSSTASLYTGTPAECLGDAGRPPSLDTDLRESFRHTCPLDGEGGRRETQTIQCRVDYGGAQAGKAGDARYRPHPHLGIAEQTFYRWKQRDAGLESEQVREFTQLEDDNTKLKRLGALGADLSLEKVLLQDVLSKKL